MKTEVTTDPKMPANPAKGNLQGQTTLAAKIDRWAGLNGNLAPLAEQMPQFKEQILQFSALLADLQALRDRQKILRGDYENTFKQRDALFAVGDDLFTRLSHALRAVHGAESSQLRHFGLKPFKRTGRPRKNQTPAPPPQPEIHTSGPVPAGGAPGATPAPRSE